MGVPQEVLLKIAEGLGGGIGGSRQSACGAAIGAVMAAGLKFADGNIDAPVSKEQTYAISLDLMKKFEEKTGAILCKDIKGLETGVPICACEDCIRCAVQLTEELLGL